MKIPDDLPGYREAVKTTEDARLVAFLDDVTHTICGVEIQWMTLRQLSILYAADDPFLLGGRLPVPADVLRFLWVLSPGFIPGTKREASAARETFIGEVAALNAPFGELCAAIRTYLDLVFMDAPPSSDGDSTKESVVSFQAALINIFATEYHWSPEHIVNSRLTALYQYLRLITLRHDPKAIAFNRATSKVKGDYLRQLQATADAERTIEAAKAAEKPKPKTRARNRKIR